MNFAEVLRPTLVVAAVLLLTAVIFGLAHWNKRAVHFNWRDVLMAAIVGVF